MNTTPKRIGIVGTVGVPAKYGGFETLVHHLVLNWKGHIETTVYCSAKAYTREEQVNDWEGANIEYIPLKANGAQSILYDLISIWRAIRSCDVVLILGVSGCLFLPIFKMISKKKIIVNIDGLEWRRPKWNWLTKRFLMWSERMACKFADEIVTDNRILKEYAKIRYNINGRLIEYGADHTTQEKIQYDDTKRYEFLKGPYAFKVARIEPENNLHIILQTFAQFPEQNLVIVGNWENSKYGRSLKKYYSQYEHIYLLDPIYEPKELNLLRSNATYYVHGHSAGGTNPSLVEAMYLNLPVLAFDVIYNRVTTNNQALFFSDSEELADLLKRIDTLPLKRVANALYTYAKKRYTWKNVANRYADIALDRHPVLLLPTKQSIKQEEQNIENQLIVSENDQLKVREKEIAHYYK